MPRDWLECAQEIKHTRFFFLFCVENLPNKKLELSLEETWAAVLTIEETGKEASEDAMETIEEAVDEASDSMDEMIEDMSDSAEKDLSESMDKMMNN